uniref:Uncharacterized protein n=1 Tax=Setaria italica TaxID=4555 RepID=K3YWZ7_SETIT
MYKYWMRCLIIYLTLTWSIFWFSINTINCLIYFVVVTTIFFCFTDLHCTVIDPVKILPSVRCDPTGSITKERGTGGVFFHFNITKKEYCMTNCSLSQAHFSIH